jgi:hypothetical protein
MEAVVVSYTGGLFGEFLCSELSKSNIFANDRKIELTPENRYLYPNYLLPIKLDVKTWPSDKVWPITKDHLSTLNELYQNKKILIPTHWFQLKFTNCNLPGIGLRLHCQDIKWSRLSYCLYWIKSHARANSPWELRKQEIEQLISDNHRFTKEFKELLKPGNYMNWKYISYRYDVLNNGELDLKYYINKKWKLFESTNKTIKNFPFKNRWQYFDIGQAIYGDQLNLYDISKIVGVELDSRSLKQYAQTNLEILEDKLKITIDDLDHDSKWISALYQYAVTEINS